MVHYATLDRTAIRDCFHVADLVYVYVSPSTTSRRVESVLDGDGVVRTADTGSIRTPDAARATGSWVWRSGSALRRDELPRQVLGRAPPYGIAEIVRTAWGWQLPTLCFERSKPSCGPPRTCTQPQAHDRG